MRTSAKHPCRLIAAALAALQLCAGAAGAVFDNSFSYTYSLGSGLQYSRTEGKNSAGLQRDVYKRQVSPFMMPRALSREA